ncbi:MAG TPA: universal stress protein [Candidatus Methylomirabilis sp.]|nr:universal stress protein [Candidatus Methylomirabilis sp.]
MPDAEGKVELAQRFQRILWPTDFSAFARIALPHVHGLVRRNEAGLVLLHVLTPAEADVEPGITGQIWDSLLVEGRRRAEAQLALLAEELQSLGVRVETLLGEGVAFQEILRVAERQRCDLIILASHGRTGLGHVLIGSVAEKVVRRASCPVFVVRPPGVVPPD